MVLADVHHEGDAVAHIVMMVNVVVVVVVVVIISLVVCVYM